MTSNRTCGSSQGDQETTPMCEIRERRGANQRATSTAGGQRTTVPQAFSRLLYAMLPLSLVFAGPASIVPVGNLVSQAQSIVVATVAQANISSGVAQMTLNVQRALKGSMLPGAVVSVAWSGPPMGPSALQRILSEQGLFFLTADANGQWRILPVVSGNVDVQMTYYRLPSTPRPAPYVAAKETPVVDKVLLELAWAKETGTAYQGTPIDLVGEFRHSRSQALRPIFTRFAQSASPNLRAIGLQAMIADGDVRGLVQVEAEQRNISTAPGARSIFDEIKFYFGNSEPAAIAVLGRLATSTGSVSAAKDSAAAALARLHTKESIPFLAELLDSPDPAIRAYAVGGLAMFANNVPIGSHQPAAGDWSYRTEETIAHSAMDPGRVAAREAYYIGFWKDWWAKHRTQLTGR